MVVIDNSVLIEIGRKSKNGLALQSLLLKEEKIIAPNLLPYEAVSTIRKLALQGAIDKQNCALFLENLLALVDAYYSARDLQVEALNEAIRLNHSSYDMFYFVLARRTGATLLTLDKKLMELCLNNGVSCVQELALG